MKLFFKDDNMKEKVYVHTNDLMYLAYLGYYVPIPNLLNNDEKSEFICYENPQDIDYFKNIDWIIDYNYYNSLSNDELTDEIKKIYEQMNTLESIGPKEQEIKQYMLNACIQVMAIQQGIVPIKLPHDFSINQNSKQPKLTNH